MEFIAALLPLLIVGTLVYGIFKSFSAYGAHKKRLENTFDRYKTENPDCIKNDKTTCNQCGGDQIFIRVLEHRVGGEVNSHVCRNCGKELYCSLTKN
jgi:hypothetical protein